MINAFKSYLLILFVVLKVFANCRTNSGYKFSDGKVSQYTMIYDIEF
jgi:hypothetical protein